MTRNSRSYNIHGLLEIVSDFDCYVPNYFLTTTKYSNPDIILNYSKTGAPSVLNSRFTQIAPNLHVLNNERLVVSSISISKLKATWSIRNVLERPTEVYLNRTYRLLSKTLLTNPISTAFPDHAYIQMIMHVKLLYKNHTFLVGACFEPSEGTSAILISSMGGMGKTLTLLELLKEIKSSYLSDDMVIVNKDGTVFSYPKPIRLRRINISPLALETYVPPAQVIGSTPIARRSQIGTICLLEHGIKNEIQKLDREEALTKLLAITRKLLPYYMERTLLAYSYMDSSFNLDDLRRTETEIIRQFLSHANIYTLKSSSSNPSSYVKLLKDLQHEYM